MARDRSERLVDLDPLHIADRLAGLGESDRAGVCRRARRGRRNRRRRSPARRSWRAARARAAPPTRSLQTITQLAPSLTPGALPAVVVPSGSNTGFSAASFSTVVSRRTDSSAVTSPTATSSSSNRPSSCAAAARCVRARGPLVLLAPRDPELARDARVLLHHVQTVEGAGEPVVDHRVEHLAVSEPVAEARLREQVRRIRHRLHATRDDDVDVAGADHRVRDLDRPDRRRADLVDRVGRRLDRQPGRDRRLPRRRLPGARLQHLAHDHVLRLVRLRRRSAPAPRRSRARRARSPGTAPARRRACRTASEPH